MQVTDRYLLSASPSNVSTAKYARPGELFGRIELNAELSDDSKVRTHAKKKVMLWKKRIF